MTTENEGDPEFRIKALKGQVQYLQGSLHSKKQECANLHGEVARWKRIAEEERRSWHRTHDAMNLLRQDAQSVLDTHDAAPLHHELETAREEIERLRGRLARCRELTRKAVEEMAAARQGRRDAEEVTGQLRQKVTDLEQQLERVAAQAKDVIDQRDAQAQQIKAWCDRWVKGEFGAMEVLAAITGVLNCNLLLEPDVLERRRALAQIETLALMNEAASSLGEIVELLAREGVSLVDTPVQMVQDYIRWVKEKIGG